MSDTNPSVTGLDEFMYLVSHDLKADVRGLNDIPDWILEDCNSAKIDLPRDVREHLELIQLVAGRLNRRIDRLMEYRHAGRVSEAPKIESATEQIQLAWNALNPPSGFSLQLPRSDTEYLTHVEDTASLWREVLHNAFVHSQEPKGHVGVSFDKRKGAVHIRIEDDGPGIECAYWRHVFQPFSTRSKGQTTDGVGLGLTIARRISEACSGNIYVTEPQGDRGCAVVVSLPTP
jgi:signal transduction histidine kinase